MRNRGAFEPQGDAAFGCGAGFHVVDDKGGLFLMVHVEPGFVAGDDDLHVNPSRGHDVDVRLVTRRCLFAQGGPRVLWVRDILCGVVAALLIVRAAVGGAQIKAVVGLAIGLHAERHTDETARATGGSGGGFAGEIDLDGAVGEFEAIDEGEVVAAAGFTGAGFFLAGLLLGRSRLGRSSSGRSGQLDGGAALERDGCGDDVVQSECSSGGEGKLAVLREERGRSRRADEEEDGPEQADVDSRHGGRFGYD